MIGKAKTITIAVSRPEPRHITNADSLATYDLTGLTGTSPQRYTPDRPVLHLVGLP
jgi:hypothetical protein